MTPIPRLSPRPVQQHRSGGFWPVWVLIPATIIGLTALFHSAVLSIGGQELHRDITRLEGTGSTPAGVVVLLYRLRNYDTGRGDGDRANFTSAAR